MHPIVLAPAFMPAGCNWLLAYACLLTPLLALLVGILWDLFGPKDCSRCLECYYDLRGTPGNACPECGAERQDAKDERKQ